MCKTFMIITIITFSQDDDYCSNIRLVMSVVMMYGDLTLVFGAILTGVYVQG